MHALHRGWNWKLVSAIILLAGEVEKWEGCNGELVMRVVYLTLPDDECWTTWED